MPPTATRVGVAIGTIGSLCAAPAVAAEPVGASVGEPGGPYCVTTALPVAAIEAGATSDIECYSTLEEAFASADASAGAGASRAAGGDTAATSQASYLLAIHFDAGVSGYDLLVYGEACDGRGISLAGDWWNDRISTTQHRYCGTVKHIDHGDYTGDYEITSGGFGSIHFLGPLNNRVSSVRYG